MLSGAVDAAGRLPFSVPAGEAHLPAFDPDATTAVYDRWFGQRLLDRLGVPAAYPLGFGLSYTSFALEGLEVGAPDGEALHARVIVRNTGDRAGRHVVQLYGEPQDAGEDVPARVLLGFASVAVGAGEAVPVELTRLPPAAAALGRRAPRAAGRPRWSSVRQRTQRMRAGRPRASGSAEGQRPAREPLTPPKVNQRCSTANTTSGGSSATRLRIGAP